jgi:hypothetical protein
MATSLQRGPENGHPDRESSFTRFRRRITESRYFMMSLLVHGIIVIVAGSIVLYRTVMPVEDFVSAGEIAGMPEGEKIEVREAPAEPQPNVERTQTTPELGGAVKDLPYTNAPSIPIPMPGKPGPGRNPFGSSRTDVPPIASSGTIPRVNGVPVGIPDIFRRRFDPKKIPGLTDKAVLAVQRSLKWLRENQNADGSWGDGNRGAMTGLALLCYLGFGELPDSKEYGYTINAAVNWIVENGTKFEGRLGMEHTFTQGGVYEHGIATYALGEYYAITHDDRVLELLRQAIAHIVQGQGPGGGWMYGFDKTANDLSVSGWQIQALKAAHLTGLKLPGVDSALDKAMSYLEAVKGPKGGYGYRAAEDRYSLSGVGILSRLFWKGERGELRKGMEWILDETAKARPVKYASQTADLYAWYYHTQASLMFGGAAWTKWNRWFQDELCNAQNTDGSWPIPGAKGHGPQGEPGRTGQVYRTTLCTLMLEVFYRYMPTNQG